MGDIVINNDKKIFILDMVTWANKRDITLDVTRALCILWIVGYYHLENYVQDDFFFQYCWDSHHGKYVTICVLSAFTFLSGYFLRKYSINSKSDIIIFYRKRLHRFWIPFFLSALILHIASLCIHHPWFISHWHFIATVLGLSVFTPPSPGTIWYISMLMTFYMITPFVLYLKSVSIKLFVSIMLVVAMAMLVNEYNLNIRTVYYLPVYLISLQMPSKWVQIIKEKWLFFLVISLVVLIVTLFMLDIRWISIVTSIVFGPIFLISLSSFLAKSYYLCKFSGVISYSSMNMYLFHRHIFMVFVLVSSSIGIGSFHDMKTSLWLLLFIALPIIITFSYYCQKLYDRLCKSLGW